MNTANSITNYYVKSLKNKKNEVDYETLFPDFFAKNNKAKVLYVSPRLDENGYYQHILPAIYLSKKGKYITSCITNINKSKQELDCTTDKFTVPKKLIELSDIIIFPFVNQDLTPLYRAIRGINKHCKICYTVDYNFYDVPANHIRKTLFTKEDDLKKIETNIFYSDKVFIQNYNFIDKLKIRMDKKFEIKKNLIFENIPFLLSPENYRGIDFNLEPEIEKENKIRFGIISYWHNQEDIEYFKPILKWINKKYKDKAEIVFWGVDPQGLDINSEQVDNGGLKEIKNDTLLKLKEKFNKVDLIEYRFFKRDSYFYHYKDFYNLNLDCLFSIRKNNDWNKYNRSVQEIIDAVFYNINVISNHNFSDLDESFYMKGNNENELKEIIKNFIEKNGEYKELRENAKQQVMANFVYKNSRWEELENIILSF